jgi:hypothetical protein
MSWLRYDLMPQPKRVGEQIRNARLARGVVAQTACSRCRCR